MGLDGDDTEDGRGEVRLFVECFHELVDGCSAGPSTRMSECSLTSASCCGGIFESAVNCCCANTSKKSSPSIMYRVIRLTSESLDDFQKRGAEYIEYQANVTTVPLRSKCSKWSITPMRGALFESDWPFASLRCTASTVLPVSLRIMTVYSS